MERHFPSRGKCLMLRSPLLSDTSQKAILSKFFGQPEGKGNCTNKLQFLRAWIHRHLDVCDVPIIIRGSSISNPHGKTQQIFGVQLRLPLIIERPPINQVPSRPQYKEVSSLRLKVIIVCIQVEFSATEPEKNRRIRPLISSADLNPNSVDVRHRILPLGY